MPTPNEKFLTVRLPVEEYDRLCAEADLDDRKFGPMARLLIREALDARGTRRDARAALERRRVVRDAPQA